MYALLCLFFIAAVWMAFVHRIFINLRRENEIKRNTQEYFKSKIIKLKKEVYERGGETTEAEGEAETGS